MSIDNKITENLIRNIDLQIQYHESQINSLKTLKDSYLNPHVVDNKPQKFAKLTQEFVRHFMKHSKSPIRTTEMIDAVMIGATEIEKKKAIKTLSVIFNTLEKSGEIKSEKRIGVKGNYYEWAGK